MTNPDIIEKDPNDVYGVVVNYPANSDLLPVGKTIASATVSAADKDGADATNTILGDTSAAVTANSVTVPFKAGGTLGDTYTVRINITLAPSGTLSDTLRVKMRDF